MKNRLRIFTIVLLSMFLVASGSNFTFAQDNQNKVKNSATKVAPKKSSAQVSKGAVEKEKKRVEDIKKKLNETAIKAVAQTWQVLKLLDNNEKDKALELLKKVIGELEVVLAANKDISLIPINAYNVIIDPKLSVDGIEKAISEVKKMLNKGDIQGARVLLNTLQCEIDIVIENLPLATYPDAMKLASKYLIDGKVAEAKSVLSVALNSMVIETIVIPLPLVRASGLIKEASKVAKTDKEQALKYLDDAEEQLRIAQLLGYGNTSPEVYEELDKKIKDIKKEIKGKNKAEQMFEELMKKLKEFKEKLISKK